MLTSCIFSLKHILEEQNMSVERTNAKYFVNTEELLIGLEKGIPKDTNRSFEI